MKKYLYDGKTYLSEKDLRNAIFEKERKAFGKPPSELKSNSLALFKTKSPNVNVPKTDEEFWAQHGVEYTVEETGINVEKFQKKMRVKQAFKSWLDNAKLDSSLGFKIDAGTKSRNSIDDLLETVQEGETVSFRDALNETHELTIDDLKTLKKEIAQNNIYAHEQKWALDKKVEEASDQDGLRSIRIAFSGKAFGEVKSEPTASDELGVFDSLFLNKVLERKE
jgi:hypothetical protein